MDLDALFENRADVPEDAAAAANLLPGGGGVYALTDEADRLILLACAESLRRAILYRLAPPEVSKKRADLRAVVRRVRWRRTYSPFETAYEFHRISRTLMPKEYRDLGTFGPAWFVVADVQARLPRLTTTRYLPPREAGGLSGTACGDAPPGGRTPSHGRVELGPLPTRQSAERLIEMLEDVFDLCRYYHILERAPDGQPCTYHDMGRCPAPCNGSIPLDRYREMVGAAVAFACGGWRADVLKWRADMRELARRQEFEAANRLKRRLQQAGLLDGEHYRFVRPIEQFNYLVIQRGAGTSRVRPFLVRGGWIERGESAARKELPTAAAAWLEAMKAGSSPPPSADAALLSEGIWLVSHYLFKGERAPGLFLGPDEWPHLDRWLARVEPEVLRRKTAREKTGDQGDPDSQSPSEADRPSEESH